MIKVKFKEWDCVLEFAKYRNERIAIELVDANDGELVTVATVNVPDEEIEADEVIIKDYSENEGILKALISAGIISEPIRDVITGFELSYVCKLLVKP